MSIEETPENSAGKKRGRPPAAQTSGVVKVTLTLDPDDTEWAKRQPEGLSGMVRRMVKEARLAEEKRSKK